MGHYDWLLFLHLVGLSLASGAVGAVVAWLWHEPLARENEKLRDQVRDLHQELTAKEAADRRWEISRGPHR